MHLLPLPLRAAKYRLPMLSNRDSLTLHCKANPGNSHQLLSRCVCAVSALHRRHSNCDVSVCPTVQGHNFPNICKMGFITAALYIYKAPYSKSKSPDYLLRCVLFRYQPVQLWGFGQMFLREPLDQWDCYTLRRHEGTSRSTHTFRLWSVQDRVNVTLPYSQVKFPWLRTCLYS